MKKWLVSALMVLVPVASFAAVQVVVLNVQDAGSGRVSYNYLCWLNAPNPLPNPSFVSAWKALGASAGPSAAQITALQNGTVIEQTGSVTVSSATAISSVENTLTSDCSTRQAYISNIPGAGSFYGFTWNGTAWVQQ
jgi:hypothetical protein